MPDESGQEERFPRDAIGDSQRRRRRRKRRRQQIRVRSLAVLPSALTVGNAICGFAAVVALVKAYAHLQVADHAGFAAASKDMEAAAFFLAGAMLCDALDGKVARLTGTAGRFGAELDSLCDAVSFCLAPALFLRVFGEAVFGVGIDGPLALLNRLLWAVCALYLACGVIRLARFNVEAAEDTEHNSFRGLPSPGAAGAVLSLFFLCWSLSDPATGQFSYQGVLSIAIPAFGALIALLMVSRIRYVHLFNVMLSGGRPLWQLILGGGGIAILFIVAGPAQAPAAFAGLFLVYVLSGPLIAVYKMFRYRARIRLISMRMSAARAPSKLGESRRDDERPRH